jgi:hypothetical protein
MKVRSLGPGLAAAALTLGLSLPAEAGLVVLDAWQLQTAAGTTTNIGRLNLVSGSSTVYQEVNGAGDVFVGASFAETGVIYSISYTPNSVVGPLDVGAPVALTENLTITFSNVAGHVDSLLSGGGFHFLFDSGSFVITGDVNGGTASGSIVGLDGTVGSSLTATGVTGATTILGQILSTSGITFRDSGGISLNSLLASGEILFEATTNNQITSASAVGACPAGTPFDAGDQCRTVLAASAGDAYLVRAVPEPSGVALAGLALGLLGFVSRRAKKG